MLLLGSVLPRRADTTAVTDTALLASALGVGYRRIAADIGRSLSTVRRWLRSVRGGHTQRLHAQGVVWIPPSTARC
jgi:transposase